jgi:hypothetical protein
MWCASLLWCQKCTLSMSELCVTWRGIHLYPCVTLHFIILWKDLGAVEFDSLKTSHPHKTLPEVDDPSSDFTYRRRCLNASRWVVPRNIWMSWLNTNVGSWVSRGQVRAVRCIWRSGWKDNSVMHLWHPTTNQNPKFGRPRRYGVAVNSCRWWVWGMRAGVKSSKRRTQKEVSPGARSEADRRHLLTARYWWCRQRSVPPLPSPPRHISLLRRVRKSLFLLRRTGSKTSTCVLKHGDTS